MALEDVEHTELLPAHNLVLHEAAELGLLGSVLAGGLLALVEVIMVRRGSWALALSAPMAASLTFDAYPYVFPIGLVLLARAPARRHVDAGERRRTPGACRRRRASPVVIGSTPLKGRHPVTVATTIPTERSIRRP